MFNCDLCDQKNKEWCYQIVNCEISVNKKKVKRVVFLTMNYDIS